MRRRRSAEVCEVIGPVGAALHLDDLLERLPLERREGRLVVELRLRERCRCRTQLCPRSSLGGTNLARLTSPVLGGGSGIQFVEALRSDLRGAANNQGSNLIGATAFPPLNVREEIGAGEITVSNLTPCGLGGCGDGGLKLSAGGV